MRETIAPSAFARSPGGLAPVVCISDDSSEMITLPRRAPETEMALHLCFSLVFGAVTVNCRLQSPNEGVEQGHGKETKVFVGGK